jgi:hypothetical protein
VIKVPLEGNQMLDVDDGDLEVGLHITSSNSHFPPLDIFVRGHLEQIWHSVLSFAYLRLSKSCLIMLVSWSHRFAHPPAS